ncbi:MAG: zinc finger domain-containing protein [Eubacteriaceae bacterium]
MLEIPESYNRSQELKALILGKKIQNVQANVFPHGFAFYFGNPEEYHNRLYSKVITTINAYGGMIEIEAENFRILFGDGINLRFLEENEKLPLKYQMSIEFEDATKLIASVQMYGGLWVYEEGENVNPYYSLAKEKPNPIYEEFTQEYFEDIWKEASPKLSVKAFLGTEQRIPGLGNGTLQDILFNARVNPKTKLQFLEKRDMANIYVSIKETLLKMTTLGGRDTEKDIFGISGGYKTVLSKNTYKKPCPVCGGSITKEAYLGGSVYYCPECQPLKKG